MFDTCQVVRDYDVGSYSNLSVVALLHSSTIFCLKWFSTERSQFASLVALEHRPPA